MFTGTGTGRQLWDAKPIIKMWMQSVALRKSHVDIFVHHKLKYFYYDHKMNAVWDGMLDLFLWILYEGRAYSVILLPISLAFIFGNEFVSASSLLMKWNQYIILFLNGWNVSHMQWGFILTLRNGTSHVDVKYYSLNLICCIELRHFGWTVSCTDTYSSYSSSISWKP